MAGNSFRRPDRIHANFSYFLATYIRARGYLQNRHEVCLKPFQDTNV
jgi:hypothetical protein